MLILGIDPGSVTTGWGLVETVGNRINYIDSGVLSFNSKTKFLSRMQEIKLKSDELFSNLSFDEVSVESLIYVKSPTSLIKLAQTRGVLLSSCLEDYGNNIYEYSPNEVKASATGYGHSDKLGIKKFLDMILGSRDYQSHDESDALAIAICHALNRGKNKSTTIKKSSSRGLAGSLSHAIQGNK